MTRARKKVRPMTPTGEQFSAYEGAFNYFNGQLFEGTLPPLMLNFSRRAQSRGFYCPEMWRNGSKEEAVAELSLDPDVLDRPPRDALSTLVHEMCHHWQFCLGKPSRRGYHNKEWAGKMVEIGLHPSDTGEPGGAIVGQHMTHYILDGGPFDRSFVAMPQEFLLPWTSADHPALPALCGSRRPRRRVSGRKCVPMYHPNSSCGRSNRHISHVVTDYLAR